jgi:hypothetical protein
MTWIGVPSEIDGVVVPQFSHQDMAMVIALARAI